MLWKNTFLEHVVAEYLDAVRVTGTHLRVHIGNIEELVSTFSAHWQSNGQIQEVHREVTCWNL